VTGDRGAGRGESRARRGDLTRLRFTNVTRGEREVQEGDRGARDERGEGSRERTSERERERARAGGSVRAKE
jgi:hypothetical protein